MGSCDAQQALLPRDLGVCHGFCLYGARPLVAVLGQCLLGTSRADRTPAVKEGSMAMVNRFAVLLSTAL